MKIVYFFRPKMVGVHSIETLFQNIIQQLPNNIKSEIFTCTPKWKRFHSFIRSRKHQGDINHITGDIHTIALFLKKSKTILTIHDIGRYDRDLSGIRKAIFKLLWLDLPVKKAKYITTISDFTKKRLIEECNLPPEKIHVIPNPSYSDFNFSQKKYDEINPCILQIGSGNNKNIFRLIDAIKGTTFKLLLIRKPDKKIEELLNNASIKFEWKYNISREEVYNSYKKCDIVFFASEYEGFGVPILEANSIGRPVITSNIGSMPYVSGDSALLVNPYNVNEIKDALLKLNSDSKLRQELIEKGIKNLDRFSIEKITQQYVDLYTSIINEK